MEENKNGGIVENGETAAENKGEIPENAAQQTEKVRTPLKSIIRQKTSVEAEAPDGAQKKAKRAKKEPKVISSDDKYEYVETHHTARKVIAAILVVIIAFFGFTSIIGFSGYRGNMKLAESFDKVSYSRQLKPETDGEGWYFFRTNSKFKVMQLTDIHLGGGFLSSAKDASALTAVAVMVAKEKPDLVIVTGDIGYPVPFQAGTRNNMRPAKLFATLMESLGVYWTLGYGNHDTELYSKYTREELSEFYEDEKWEHCLFLTGPNDCDGCGNQVIRVVNGSGFTTQALFVLDSHSYTDGDFLGIQWKYDNIHKNQVQWYEETINQIESDNVTRIYASAEKDAFKKYKDFTHVKSMLFFHIPLVEYRDAWEEFAGNGYKDTENVRYDEGIVGETGGLIYCGIGEDNLFEKVLEIGSTQAIFCGHDHFNNFSLNYKGVELVYGNSIDYLAYIGISKKGSHRGCTCVTIASDGSYTIDKYNLYSGRYDLPEGFDDGIVMQFEGVTFQYIEGAEYGTTEPAK